MAFRAIIWLRSLLLTAAALVLLCDLASTSVLPMTTWIDVDDGHLSNGLLAIKPSPPIHPSLLMPEDPASAILSSITPSQPGFTHVLTSGSIYLPDRLTLSDTFLILFRRLHSLGFMSGILGTLAVFWVVVGFTVGVLWSLSTYIKHREQRTRSIRHRMSKNESVTVEIRISRRPSNLSLSPRSALSSPGRRASYGLILPKSVRWAEQLTADEPRDPPPQYGEEVLFPDHEEVPIARAERDGTDNVSNSSLTGK